MERPLLKLSQLKLVLQGNTALLELQTGFKDPQMFKLNLLSEL
jgi:hypothetical protein